MSGRVEDLSNLSGEGIGAKGLFEHGARGEQPVRRELGPEISV